MVKKIFIGLAVLFIIIIISQGNKKSVVDTGEPPKNSGGVSTSTAPSTNGKNTVSALFSSGEFFKDAVWNDPSVVYVDNSFIMYASAGKGFSGDIDIYRLTSPDGIKWNLDPKDPVLTNGVEKEALDSHAVETPSVVYFKGMYHMFYTGYQGSFSESKKYKVLHATSVDGITWTKDTQFLLEPSNPTKLLPTLEYDQWVTAEPGAVVYKDSIYLYFAAIGGNQKANAVMSTIGLMTSSDGVSWSKPEQVLVPDQNVYPAETYYGYSTPAAAVHDGKVELYFDIVNRDPWEQIAITKAVSSDGMRDWALDSKQLVMTKSADFTTKQVVSPAVLYKEGVRYMWFAGLAGTKMTIGLLK